MDSILGDLSFCACYVDGILMFSSSKDEHLDHLSVFLDRLQLDGLPLSLFLPLPPLYASLKSKPKDLKWGPLQEVAFCNSKNAPSTADALTFHVLHAPLLLSTYVSDFSIGAALKYVVNG
ncbi:uncharacterized protein [Palaemon carinicauda]|uniref:uncharacterized protein n=1 Tax=Palaemon carinicauda TaxID=392227 RepID=UPI0035B6A037